MTVFARQPSSMTETEYLQFEHASETKHEYLAGEIFTIAGASEKHNLICTSVSFALYSQLRKRPCNVYPSDMRLKVQATGLNTYPDISIVCTDPVFADDEFDTLLNPIVLIEVLSPSTKDFDYGTKFEHYRQIPCLQDYLLIAQDKPHIGRYQRQENDTWLLSDAIGLDAIVELPSIDCTLALADVYEKVTFEA